MKILKVDKTGCYFLIEDRKIEPESLSKDDLLTLFNEIYQLENISEVEIPEKQEINDIRNPVEKEIVNQIIQKVKEFTDNLDQIKQDIESSFPSLNSVK